MSFVTSQGRRQDKRWASEPRVHRTWRELARTCDVTCPLYELRWNSIRVCSRNASRIHDIICGEDEVPHSAPLSHTHTHLTMICRPLGWRQEKRAERNDSSLARETRSGDIYPVADASRRRRHCAVQELATSGNCEALFGCGKPNEDRPRSAKFN